MSAWLESGNHYAVALDLSFVSYSIGIWFVVPTQTPEHLTGHIEGEK